MENQRRSCADRQQLAKLIGRVVLGRGSVGGGSGNQMTTDTPRDTSWPHSHVSSTPWELHMRVFLLYLQRKLPVVHILQKAFFGRM